MEDKKNVINKDMLAIYLKGNNSPNLKVVEKMCKTEGIDTNCRMDSNRNTPLTWAIINGNLKLAKTLIKSGVDCEKENIFVGESPLFLLFSLANKKEYIEEAKDVLKDLMEANVKIDRAPTNWALYPFLKELEKERQEKIERSFMDISI